MSSPDVKKWQEDQDRQNDNGENAAGIAQPLADAESEAGDQHHQANQQDGSNEQSWLAGGDPGSARRGVRDVGGCDQRDLGYLDGLHEPDVPCHQKSNSVAERQPGPFVEAALQGHQSIQVSHDESVRYEEENNGKKP